MEVQAFPDGPKLNITGTVESIRAQLLEMNPNLDEDFDLSDYTEPEESSSDEVEPSSLDKRFGPICGSDGHDWKDASKSVIKKALPAPAVVRDDLQMDPVRGSVAG
ncbi:hypothetical protein BDV12DRAFT_198841 [Aspergillus spectabilis]